MFGWKRDIIVLIAVEAALGIAYISNVPRIYIDEAWDASLGHSIANEGSLKHPFVESFGGMEVHFVQNRVVLPLVCAAIFKVAGCSIATSRAGSVIFGVVAVVSLYGVMRRWFGEKQAFWIAAATIIHPWFFEVSRRCRPEIYYTALGLVFLWLLVRYFDSGSRRTAFFAGAVAGLSVLTHPNGLIITFSIGCAIIAWLKPKSIGRLFLWSSTAFVMVILPYIIYVLWAVQNPQVSFAEQMQIGMLHKLLLKGEITRWKSFLQWPTGAPLAIIMLASWILAWYRSSAADKILATIIALFVLSLSFTTVNPTARYLATIVPFSSALIVRLIWRLIGGRSLIRQNWRKIRFAISMGVAFVYLSTCTAAISLMLYRFRGADFNRVIKRVESVVEPGSRVCGDPIFWWGRHHYQYGPWLMIDKHEHITIGKVVSWARKHHFDYVVRTAWRFPTPKGIAKPPQSMPAFRDRYSHDSFCRFFGTKVAEFRDPYYGPIEIYKLDWDKLQLNAQTDNKGR